MIRMLAAATVLATLAASTAPAATIYGTVAPLTGTRTQANFVLGGNYAGDTVSISWNISPNMDGTFGYVYEFVGFRQPGISHVILDLTDDAVTPTLDPDAVTGTRYDGILVDQDAVLEFGTFNTPGNPGFPAMTDLIGVKFDETFGSNPMTISFTSNRAPVYGDFYLKGGNDSFAYNLGLANPTSMNELDFIARPNGVGVIPEPSTLALCGISSLVGLGLASRRRLRTRA